MTRSCMGSGRGMVAVAMALSMAFTPAAPLLAAPQAAQAPAPTNPPAAATPPATPAPPKDAAKSAPFAATCRYLSQQPGVDAVQAIAFPVLPVEDVEPKASPTPTR